MITEIEVGHAVGLHFQHFGQIGRGHGFEIHGFVAVGVGIVLPAQSGHAAAEFARRHRGRAFKHHVLERVAQACFAGHLIGAAHPIPKLRHRHRRARIFFHNHFHAVGQGFGQRLRPRGQRGGQGKNQ